jgi:hypothetical protein
VCAAPSGGRRGWGSVAEPGGRRARSFLIALEALNGPRKVDEFNARKLCLHFARWLDGNHDEWRPFAFRAKSSSGVGRDVPAAVSGAGDSLPDQSGHGLVAELVLTERTMVLLPEIGVDVRLFFGPSGTDKTLAAEVVAIELELDLNRIDLGKVVSKYIGETEKNLRHVFDAAEERGALLPFDEADALFGKRIGAKDSCDRYANIGAGYLLQGIETHRSLAILATNSRENLDSAFVRRFCFVVQFPMPYAALRRQIWQRVFP